MGDVDTIGADARNGKRSVAARLRYAHVVIPVGQIVAVTGRDDLVDALQAIGGRDDLWAVLAVQVEAGIVFARTPGLIDRLLSGAQRWRQGNNGAGIELATGPAIKPLADARRECVVNGRMAKGAGHAGPCQGVFAIDSFHGVLDADHGIEFDQGDGGGGVGQTDGFILNALHDGRRQQLGIYFQAHR